MYLEDRFRHIFVNLLITIESRHFFDIYFMYDIVICNFKIHSKNILFFILEYFSSSSYTLYTSTFTIILFKDYSYTLIHNCCFVIYQHQYISILQITVSHTVLTNKLNLRAIYLAA